MTIRRVLAAAAVAGATLVAGVDAADASHAHFILREGRDGVTYCQYFGAGQTSIADTEHGGWHQVHEHVHAGQPGSDQHGTDVDKSDNETRCDVVSSPGPDQP